MKNRLILCLALVLSGGLLGCAHAAWSPKALHGSEAAGGLPATEQTDLPAIHRVDSTDWRKVLESPAALRDPYYGEFAQKLKHGQVPTEQEAITRAIGASGSVDMRTTWRVSALLRLAQPDKDLGEAGDFVWEVRVIHTSNSEDIAGLIWVGTTTGKTKVLYPP